MKLIVEYLITIDKNVSKPFYHLCDSVEEFDKLLQTNPDIIIGNNGIKYKQRYVFAYEAKTNTVEGKEQRFFHIRITFDQAEENLEEYVKLLKAVKSIIHESGGQPETLWDDISFYYSNKAYPLIHKIENMMRKLIAYFMLTAVGKEWVVEASPSAVREAIDRSKRKEHLDVLHQIDFVHLGDFLFKSYQTGDVTKLYDKLDKAEKLEDLNLDDLKSFVTKSNWERYFSEIVDCEDAYLRKRWDQLYDLRCKVAHNAIVVKNDYERIVELADKVGEKLQKAIDNIDQVHVPEEDREQVAENVASSISTLSGDFIQSWRLFENTLNRLAAELGVVEGRSDRMPSTPMQILQKLYDEELIDDSLIEESKELITFRNNLVHGRNFSLDEQEIHNYILRLEELKTEFKPTWKDEVLNAIRALGGEASLSEIYEHIENTTSRTLSKTWQATIRRTLQTYSSDTETYKGGEDLFTHLGRGLWGLRNSDSDDPITEYAT